MNSVELYDIASGTWSTAASMNTARTGHNATMLPDGRVLVAGGGNNSGRITATETYDPPTNTWTPSGPLTFGRESQRSALVFGTQVLIAGGVGQNGSAVGVSERYEPSTGQWTLSATFNMSRYGHTLTLLQDGRVLAAGGRQGNATDAELYVGLAIPGTWSPSGTPGEKAISSHHDIARERQGVGCRRFRQWESCGQR